MSPIASRRAFVASTVAAALGAPALLGQNKTVPVGLELFSVRDAFTKDEMATLVDVTKLGYEIVEFWGPYYEWTPAHAREIRAQLDGLGIRCLSTHNDVTYFSAENLPKAIELNQILGSKYIINSSIGKANEIFDPKYIVMITRLGRPEASFKSADGWKAYGELMARVLEQLRPLGMATGFHNHDTEWASFPDGRRPMDALAASTPDDFVLQLDVGTAVKAGADPVAWIKAHPGRIKSIHCKDWGAGQGPDRGYRVLFGEGDAPWKAIFEAAESAGGVEYYLIEQEGSRFPELETARRCLDTWKQMRA